MSTYTNIAQSNPPHCDEDGAGKRKPPKRSPGFPSRLCIMLDRAREDGFDHIVSWMPCGTAFKIHNEEAFVAILQKFFRQTSFRSFARQLQIYRFTRVCRGVHKGECHHPLVRRGQPHLLTRRSLNDFQNNGSDIFPVPVIAPDKSDGSASLLVGPPLTIRVPLPVMAARSQSAPDRFSNIPTQLFNLPPPKKSRTSSGTRVRRLVSLSSSSSSSSSIQGNMVSGVTSMMGATCLGDYDDDNSNESLSMETMGEWIYDDNFGDVILTDNEDNEDDNKDDNKDDDPIRLVHDEKDDDDDDEGSAPLCVDDMSDDLIDDTSTIGETLLDCLEAASAATNGHPSVPDLCAFVEGKTFYSI